MNNAKLIMEEETDVAPLHRERIVELTAIIEALRALNSSNHWNVLTKYIFEVELSKSKSRLETESDTTEIFRLQGEARLGKRYQLDKLLTKYTNELSKIRKNI